MKTTIKTALIAISFLLATVSINAQYNPITFGVKAGMNISNVNGDVSGTDAKIGFNAGVTLDYGFTSNIYLLTGLELTTKGFKVDDADASANLMYLQLPVHVGYKLPVTDGTNIVFRAGPYVAYGIAGKTKVVDPDDGQKYKENSFGDKGAFKRFDFGLGFGVGAEFGKINAGVGCDFGLLNIADTSGGGKIRNMNVSISVGYKF